MERSRDLVGEDIFDNIDERVVKNIVDCHSGDIWIILRVIFLAFFDKRDGDRASHPAMLSTEWVGVILEILCNDCVFMIV
jgi:hypothetical protein